MVQTRPFCWVKVTSKEGVIQDGLLEWMDGGFGWAEGDMMGNILEGVGVGVLGHRDAGGFSDILGEVKEEARLDIKVGGVGKEDTWENMEHLGRVDKGW